MIRAYIIGESIRPGASLQDLKATLVSVDREEAGNAAPNQPKVWTTVVFDTSLESDRLAANLSKILDDRPTVCYTHFRAGEEMFVVFPGRIFRYPVGDTAGRSHAQDYARAVGVPGRQVDWSEA